MDALYVKARTWLNNATRQQIRMVMREGMFSRTQKESTLMRRKGITNQAIAIRLHCDIRTIDRECTKIYKMVTKIIAL